MTADALALPGRYYKLAPPICDLDRGIGAAIRRARTRLPGRATNPVAIVRVPRKRMVGSGFGASLIYEFGNPAVRGRPVRPVSAQDPRRLVLR